MVGEDLGVGLLVVGMGCVNGFRFVLYVVDFSISLLLEFSKTSIF
jgi:hypothetical protein